MAHEIPEALREKLERGSALPDGATLTSDECRELLQLLPQSPGRPQDDVVDTRNQIVAQLFVLYVANGDSSKTAVDRLKDRFGMKRTQIYTARKLYRKNYENLDWSERRELIIDYENNPLGI